MIIGRSPVCVFLFLLLAVPAIGDDRASTTSPGKIAVVRSTGRASIVLEATSEVAAIVAAKSPDDDANARLERDALRAIDSRLSLLGRAASVTVHVVYSKTPEVSPAYGSLMSETLEHYADVEISGPDARSDRERWQELARAEAALPHFVRFTVTGALPPR